MRWCILSAQARPATSLKVSFSDQARPANARDGKPCHANALHMNFRCSCVNTMPYVWITSRISGGKMGQRWHKKEKSIDLLMHLRHLFCAWNTACTCPPKLL